MNNPEQESLSDNALEKELLNIWQRVLKNEQLTIDDDFFEYGGDSLLATLVVLEVEQLTGKSLPTSIIFETGTIRQLLHKITTGDEFKPRKSFFIGPKNGKIIHFFHGDTEHGGAVTKTFSAMIGNTYRIHGISPHLLHEDHLPESVEEMAKQRLPHILEVQSEGPYVILGQCNGALVGFEAARQLVALGKEVKAMVMIDPNIMPVRRSANLIFKTANICMSLIRFNEEKRLKTLRWIYVFLMFWDSQFKDFGYRPLLFFKQTREQKRAMIEGLRDYNGRLRNEEIYKYYTHAFLKYKPQPLNVPVLYISLLYSGGAWRRMTSKIVYINIRGGDHSSWKEDYSQDLVNKIRNFISR